jgi:hypothetical protein
LHKPGNSARDAACHQKKEYKKPWPLETLVLHPTSNAGNEKEKARPGRPGEGDMRKVCVPLTVLSLGGLGCLFLSERGRDALRWIGENLQQGPGRLFEWNEAAQRELDRIQVALNRVAESLEAVR